MARSSFSEKASRGQESPAMIGGGAVSATTRRNSSVPPPVVTTAEDDREHGTSQIRSPISSPSRSSYLSQSSPPQSSVESNVVIRGSRATARFEDLELQTAFQPVISLAHSKAVGFETLLRAVDPLGHSVSPLEVFRRAEVGGQTSRLEELCRTLHMTSFQLQGVSSGWLFLNMSPHALEDPEILVPRVQRLLESHEIAPHRLVIEILEGAAGDESFIVDVVAGFRELGSVVAIDDFGAGQSNFERIWRLAPDVVKLDRSMLLQAERLPSVRRILPGLVSLLHEAGCLVVMEGIESEEQALIAMEMDTDCVQGFFFAAPSPTATPSPELHQATVASLFPRFKQRVATQVRRARDTIVLFSEALERAAQRMTAGEPMSHACRELLDIPGVDRCYLLDSIGVQVGPNLETGSRSARDPRFEPFADADGANWFRRPYFRRAMTRPMMVQVSQPYLSMRDASTCVTLSIAIPHEEQLQVLCVDLAWTAGDPLPSAPIWRPVTG